MNRPLPKVATRWPQLLAWSIFAGVAGLGCIVLPPQLIPGALTNPSYGRPLVPWFESAWQNLQFAPTLSLMLVLGVALGLAQPRWWAMLACLTVSLPPLLWTVNFIHDVIRDPTSHNLFPFEVIALVVVMGVFASMTLAGGSIGWVMRGGSQSSGRPQIPSHFSGPTNDNSP